MLIHKIFLSAAIILLVSNFISVNKTTVLKIKSCTKTLNSNEWDTVKSILARRFVYCGIEKESFEIKQEGDWLSISLNNEMSDVKKKLVTEQGNFEVREVYIYSEFKDVLFNINKSLNENRLFTLLVPSDLHVKVFNDMIYENAAIGYAITKDTSAINKILKEESVQNLIPADIEFSWSAKIKNVNADSILKENYVELYALKKADKNLSLNSTNIEKISVEKSKRTKRPEVIFMFNLLAGSEWEQVTEKNIGRPLALVIDGETYSVPIIQDKVQSRYCAISAGFNEDEAKVCAALMSCGMLPDELCIAK